MDKISVYEFINDNDTLDIKYVTFEMKLKIVDNVIYDILDNKKEINTTIIRRISTQIFIENITNIDLSLTDENGLGGYDQLYYYKAWDVLYPIIKNEYDEFLLILNERISDYKSNVLHYKNDIS